jgi:hypothetical protein
LTGNRAFGADDVAGVFSARPKLRKQRFLMTDNSYQYGGASESGLEALGSPANWRCTALEKFSRVKLREDAWRTAPNHSDLHLA